MILIMVSKLKQLVRCSINLSFFVPQNKNKTFILTLTVNLLDWFEKIKKKRNYIISCGISLNDQRVCFLDHGFWHLLTKKLRGSHDISITRYGCMVPSCNNDLQVATINTKKTSNF